MGPNPGTEALMRGEDRDRHKERRLCEDQNPQPREGNHERQRQD